MKLVRKEKRRLIKIKIKDEKEKLPAELAASEAPGALDIQ